MNKQAEASKYLELESQQLTHYLQDWPLKQELLPKKKSSCQNLRYQILKRTQPSHTQRLSNPEKQKKATQIHKIQFPLITNNYSQSCNNLRSKELIRRQSDYRTPNKKITELQKMLFSIQQRAYSHCDLKKKQATEIKHEANSIKIKQELLQAMKRRKRKVKKNEHIRQEDKTVIKNIDDSITTLKQVFLSKYLQRKQKK